MTDDMAKFWGARVAQVRKARGWTQTELAARTAPTVRWDQPTIARVERGHRRLTIEDWLALSAALNTSPIYILTGLDPEDPVMVGNQNYTSHEVRDWLRGFGPLPGADRREYAESMPFDDRVFVTDPNLASFIWAVQAQARAQGRGDLDEWKQLDDQRVGLIMEEILRDEGYPEEPAPDRPSGLRRRDSKDA